MITTTKGEMDESMLLCKKGTFENDHECTNWIEYYDGYELVHRSVHVHLKQGIGIEGVLGKIG